MPLLLQRVSVAFGRTVENQFRGVKFDSLTFTGRVFHLTVDRNTASGRNIFDAVVNRVYLSRRRP